MLMVTLWQGPNNPGSRAYTEDNWVTELRFKIKQIHFPKTSFSSIPPEMWKPGGDNANSRPEEVYTRIRQCSEQKGVLKSATSQGHYGAT